MTLLEAREIAALVENAEAAAYCDMFRAAPAALGLDVEQSGFGTILHAPRFDALLLNRALAVGIESAASKTDVQRTIGRFIDSGSRNFGIQISPEAQPGEILDWLAEGGLQRRDAWTKVYRHVGDEVTIATDLRIEAAVERDAELFGHIGCQAFGMPAVLSPLMAAAVGRPGWRHYIAWNGDEPAAVAALFVHGGVGWLGAAATLPVHRRRGAQGALMARRLRDGAAGGCRWFVTETGQDTPDQPNPSYRNMKRAGFIDAYHRANYMLPKPQAPR